MKRATQPSFDWTTALVVTLVALGLGLLALQGRTSAEPNDASTQAPAPVRALADDSPVVTHDDYGVTETEPYKPSPSLRDDSPNSDTRELRKTNDKLREELKELYTTNQELSEENQRLVQSLKETKAELERTRSQLVEARRINIELLEEIEALVTESTQMISKIESIDRLEGELVVTRPANLFRRPTRSFNREAQNDIDGLEREIFLSVAEINERCNQIVREYAQAVRGEPLFSNSTQPVE
ncbi:MAG: hypothetical protein ACFBZ8_07900 [Opitutales bacterium]